MNPKISDLKSQISNPKFPISSPPLPDGWRWVKLGEVCEVVGGSTPDTSTSDYWNGEIVWVTPTDLGKLSGMTITITDRRITPAGLQSCGTEILPIGTVIMSSRAPIGHLAIAGVSLCTNQGCKSFVPSPDVDSVFLYWTLKQSVPGIQALGSGATFAEVSKSALQQFEIPLPPLAEQRRIAGVLREQMAAVEEARAGAQARLAAVKTLPAAFLRRVFPQPGQPLPDGWRWVKLGEVSSLQSSYAFKSEWFEDKGTRLLRNANIFQDHVSWDDVVCLSPHRRSEFREYDLREGDIVLSLDRPIVSAGLKVTRLGQEDIPSLLLQRVGRFNLETDFFADYLFFLLHTESFRAAITAHDYSLGVPHVSPAQIEAIDIPLPPLDEQHRIAGVLREQMASVEKARAAAEAELETINALPAAFLRKAFQGEL